MISRFIDKRKKTVVALASVSVMAIAMGLGLSRARAASQQAAPQRGAAGAARGAGARRGGGGFRHPTPVAWNDNTGFTQIFNGKNLDGWKGRSDVWHVEDGAITAQTTPQNPTGTTNIWYTRVEPANFILKEEVRMVGNGNGGIQFRSVNKAPAPRPRPAAAGRGRGARAGRGGRQMTAAQMAQRAALMQKNRQWALMGYQEDMDTAGRFDGQLYEQGTGRGIIAWPGDFVITATGQQPSLLGTVATPAEIKTWIPNPQGWNNYEIVAQGHTLIQMVNGHIISVLVDNDPKYFAAKGVIGMEIEGQNMKISYRDIQLKVLP